MAQVTIRINKRAYTIACEDGQEERLISLAELLDSQVARLTAEIGQIGDARLLLMAGLLFADELADAREEMKHLREELESAEDAYHALVGAAKTNAEDGRAAEALTLAAEKLESLADLLERETADA